MVQDVHGLLLHVLGPFRGGEKVGPGHHNRYVVVEEAGGLGYPARGQVVFRSQLLWTVLGPVSFGKQQPVPSGVGHERSHHVVGFTVLPAVFGELQGGSKAPWGSPNGPPRTNRVRAGNFFRRADPGLVVPAFQVMPALEHQAGIREAVTHGLGGDDDGVGHTARAVHGELDVREFRHVLQEPLTTQLGDTVQGIVSRVVEVDYVHGDRVACLPVSAGRGHRVNHQTVDLVRRDTGVLNSSPER